jgi:hypothetical protein
MIKIWFRMRWIKLLERKRRALKSRVNEIDGLLENHYAKLEIQTNALAHKLSQEIEEWLKHS